MKAINPQPKIYNVAPILLGAVQTSDLKRLKYPLFLADARDDEIGLDSLQCAFAEMARRCAEAYITRPGRFDNLRDPINLAICIKTFEPPPECNALADQFQMADGRDAYLILLNVETGGIIARGVSAILTALGNDGLTVLTGNTQPDRNAIQLLSIMCGQMFIFFHELSHVIRDHLHLLDTSSLAELEELPINLKSKVSRRVLETDADHLAAFFLRSILPQFFSSMVETAEITDRQRFTCALVGIFAVCGAMATQSPCADKQYHSPLVRMFSAAKRLDESLDGKTTDGDALIKAFCQRMQTGALKNEPLLAAWEYDQATYAADQASWRITEEDRAELETAGQFNRLWKKSGS